MGIRKDFGDSMKLQTHEDGVQVQEKVPALKDGEKLQDPEDGGMCRPLETAHRYWLLRTASRCRPLRMASRGRCRPLRTMSR